MEASDPSTTPAAAESNGANAGQSPWDAHALAASHTPAHPEYPVIGAFVGGFLFAKLLKKLGGGDDD